MKKIFWVDMEMTGLNPEQDVILEFAGIVTDLNLNSLDRIHAVIYQDKEKLDLMDAWNLRTHSESGLLDLIPNGQPLARVEENVLDFLKTHFENEKPVLAGNSIHQDRRFIDRYMKSLSSFLHYRMIDVSAFKIVFNHMFQVSLEKQTPHRAFDDIMASIKELKHYLRFIKVPDPAHE